MGIFENNQVDPIGDAVSFRMPSTASLWDKGESICLNNIYQAPTLCMPVTAVDARDAAVNQTDNPLSSWQVKEEAILCVTSV